MVNWFHYLWSSRALSSGNPATIGRWAERWAERYLRRRGLRPVARNWSVRGGEIDLIMLDEETLVFVETRFRRNTSWTDGLASVDAAKRRRIRLAARSYLDKAPQHEHRLARFDVVSLSHSNYAICCEWTRDAFDDTAC